MYALSVLVPLKCSVYVVSAALIRASDKIVDFWRIRVFRDNELRIEFASADPASAVGVRVAKIALFREESAVRKSLPRRDRVKGRAPKHVT